MPHAQHTTENQNRLLTLAEVAAILIQHHQIHEGRYELGISFRIGVGTVPGPEGSLPAPGAFMGVEGMSLTLAPPGIESPNIVDAAVVNPAPAAMQPKAKSRKKPA
jgi:hypothetical protein